MLDLPFNDIGKKFNHDHSTVMYSVTNVEEKMKESRELREELETLEAAHPGNISFQQMTGKQRKEEPRRMFHETSYWVGRGGPDRTSSRFT